MVERQSEASTEFHNRMGVPVGRIKVACRPNRPPLLLLSEAEARVKGMERLQLLEAQTYDFDLSGINDDYRLRETEAVRLNRFSSRSGTIETGQFTGILTIELEHSTRGELAFAFVEVRSVKVSYETDYRRMLDQIVEKSSALVMDIHGVSRMRFAPSSRLPPETIHQRFAFAQAIVRSPRFQNALARFIAMPHQRWTSEAAEASVRRGLKPGGSAARKLGTGRNRLRVPAHHPLSENMRRRGISTPSLPAVVSAPLNVESADTPENRFVKFVVHEFIRFFQAFELQAKRSDSLRASRLEAESRQTREQLQYVAGHDFFRDIPESAQVPFASTVLQRRAGYRDILRSWLQFGVASQLEWSGSSEVFTGGSRDVAKLYEYWLFFELLDMTASIFSFDIRSYSQLVDHTQDGFDLRLKSGRHILFRGGHEGNTRNLAVAFSYNRTFARATGDPQSSYPSEGSWTRAMRPDFTLSLWPDTMSESEAERQELITHVHFDAKYRADRIADIFGDDTEEELLEESERHRSSTRAKRADLLKMHAYRDAIRRTEGAYVLYPGGNEESLQWKGFHEILPGLGAFSVGPGSVDVDLQPIVQFVLDVAHHVADNATRREQQTYHVFRIQEPDGKYRYSPQLPPVDGQGRPLRPIPPAERREPDN